MLGLRNRAGARCQDRDLIYLLQLSRKHNLVLSTFHDSLVVAGRTGKALCNGLQIETRLKGEDSSSYMFSVNGEALAQANIRNDSIRKLIRLPHELSNFEADEKQRKSRLDDLKSVENKIGKMRFGSRGLTFKALVVRKSEVRAVTAKDGTGLLVCSVTLSDGTGDIPLSVWNNQIEAVSVGDLVQIQNARVRSFRGEIQLSLSRKAGVLTVLEHDHKKLVPTELVAN